MMDLSNKKKFLMRCLRNRSRTRGKNREGLKGMDSCLRVAFFTMKDTHASTHRLTISD